jgi:hypothetical protein
LWNWLHDLASLYIRALLWAQGLWFLDWLLVPVIAMLPIGVLVALGWLTRRAWRRRVRWWRRRRQPIPLTEGSQEKPMTKAELIYLIEETAAQLDQWAEQSVRGGWSTHQVDPMRKKADELRRAASQSKFERVST